MSLFSRVPETALGVLLVPRHEASSELYWQANNTVMELRYIVRHTKISRKDVSPKTCLANDAR